jgi:hypothetical protein
MIQTALWLDAADAATVTTVSGAVSQWNDKSGNARHATQGTAGNRPAYTGNSLNGLATIKYDATNDFLSLANTSGLTSATSFYLYGVRSSTVASTTETLTNRSFLVGLTGIYQMGAGPSGLLTNETATFIVGPDTPSFNPRIGANAANYSIAANSAEIYHAFGTNTSATYGARVNGSPITSFLIADAAGRTDPAGCDPALTGFNIGGTGGASNGAVVDFAEMMVLTTAPTLSNTQRIEGYLAWKWGLTANLPAGHPYKTVGPTP